MVDVTVWFLGEWGGGYVVVIIFVCLFCLVYGRKEKESRH